MAISSNWLLVAGVSRQATELTYHAIFLIDGWIQASISCLFAGIGVHFRADHRRRASHSEAQWRRPVRQVVADEPYPVMIRAGRAGYDFSRFQYAFRILTSFHILFLNQTRRRLHHDPIAGRPIDLPDSPISLLTERDRCWSAAVLGRGDPRRSPGVPAGGSHQNRTALEEGDPRLAINTDFSGIFHR